MTNVSVAPPGRIIGFGRLALAASIVAMLWRRLSRPRGPRWSPPHHGRPSRESWAHHRSQSDQCAGRRFLLAAVGSQPPIQSLDALHIDPVTNAPTIGLEVSIAGNPTGQVFNGNSAAFNGDAFVFASEAARFQAGAARRGRLQRVPATGFSRQRLTGPGNRAGRRPFLPLCGGFSWERDLCREG